MHVPIFHCCLIAPPRIEVPISPFQMTVFFHLGEQPLSPMASHPKTRATAKRRTLSRVSSLRLNKALLLVTVLRSSQPEQEHEERHQGKS